MEEKLCKDCVNFIEYEGKMMCDFERFQGVDLYKALLYSAELHDCDDWETLNE